LVQARTVAGVGSAEATGRLIEQLEDGTTKTHEIGDGSVSIGTAAECAILLARTEGVAAYHARVSFRQGRYMLHHTGGPNFVTSVGSERVEWVRLDAGDEIRVGTHRFLFEERNPSA
jgi:predicted component of type VI protein secretion system